jgi:hypothetical protein
MAFRKGNAFTFNSANPSLFFVIFPAVVLTGPD